MENWNKQQLLFDKFQCKLTKQINLKTTFQHQIQPETSTYLYSYSRKVSVCECWGGRRPLYTVLLRKGTKRGPTRARRKGVRAVGPAMNHREPNSTEAGGSHGKQRWLAQTGSTFDGVAASRAHQLYHHTHFVWHDESLFLYLYGQYKRAMWIWGSLQNKRWKNRITVLIMTVLWI